MEKLQKKDVTFLLDSEDYSLLKNALCLARGSSLFFVICPEGEWREKWMNSLKDYLYQNGQSVIQIELTPQTSDFQTQLRNYSEIKLAVSNNYVIFFDIKGFELSDVDIFPEKAAKTREILQQLNFQRESLAKMGVPIVFWLNNSNLLQFTRYAADLFSGRSGIFYLEYIPEREYEWLLPETKDIDLLFRDAISGVSESELRKRAILFEKSFKTELSEHSPSLARLASLVREIGVIYHQLGKNKEAIKYLRISIESYRRLVEKKLEGFWSFLGKSLIDLSLYLSEIGEYGEARDAAQEASQIFRKLVREDPENFLSALAKSLNNLANILNILGQLQEALPLAQEAVDIHRKLVSRNPEIFLPELASNLNNLAIILSKLGKQQEALASAQEAVEIRRKLAVQNPELFLPHLASSLNNLTNRLSELGRYQESIQIAQEVVDIYRKLSEKNPSGFLPYLALSLNNLASYLSTVGRRKDSLQYAQEAVEIYRKLASQNSQAFNSELARTLIVQGKILLKLGKARDAHTSFKEALQILLPFARKLPDAFPQLLDFALQNYLESAKEAGVDLDKELVNEVKAVLDLNKK